MSIHILESLLICFYPLYERFMKNMEIEIKYFLPNYDAVKEYLDKHAKIDKIDVMQRDRYFMPAHEDYT